MKSRNAFWQNILSALETEPRKVVSIRGHSGHSHLITALGIDEKRKRIVIVSGEADARLASLAQADIQAANPSYKFVMARPIAINLSHLAKLISHAMGTTSIGQKELQWLGQNKEEFEKQINNSIAQTGELISHAIATPLGATAIDMIVVIKEAIQQLALVEVENSNNHGVHSGFPTFDITKLQFLDPAEADRKVGVCSIPLYNFPEAQIERLKEHDDPDLARKLLTENGVFQYFFPAPDQLALGLVDRGTAKADDLMTLLKATPQEGHPFGPYEIIDSKTSFMEILSILQQDKLIEEGEIGLEISTLGEKFRARVKLRPREGLISKILRIVNININLNLKELLESWKTGL